MEPAFGVRISGWVLMAVYMLSLFAQPCFDNHRTTQWAGEETDQLFLSTTNISSVPHSSDSTAFSAE